MKSGKVRGWTLAKYLALQYILQSSTKSSVVHPSTVGKSGHTDQEANRDGSAVPHDKAVALAACRQPGGCRRIPYFGSEMKNSVRKTVSTINTVRKSQAASRWGPWKFRPSTAYDVLLPHTHVQARVPGQWVGYILCCAWTPYLGWANEPRADKLPYYYLKPSIPTKDSFALVQATAWLNKSLRGSISFINSLRLSIVMVMSPGHRKSSDFGSPEPSLTGRQLSTVLSWVLPEGSSVFAFGFPVPLPGGVQLGSVLSWGSSSSLLSVWLGVLRSLPRATSGYVQASK